LYVQQNDMNLLNKAMINKEIEKREKKTKILTQLKKDVAIKNFKKQIIVKF
jgi:hypothetical protein